MKAHQFKIKRNQTGASLITLQKKLTQKVQDHISIMERQGYAWVDTVYKGSKTVYTFTKKSSKYDSSYS